MDFRKLYKSTHLHVQGFSRQQVKKLLLPLVDEVKDLVQDQIRTQARGEVVLAHEDVGNESLAELLSAFGMTHKCLVPVVAGSDQPICDVKDHQVRLGPGAAIVDKEAFEEGRDRAQAVKLRHLLGRPRTLQAC